MAFRTTFSQSECKYQFWLMSAKLNYICIQDLYNGSPKINVREYGRGHQKRTIQQTGNIRYII